MYPTTPTTISDSTIRIFSPVVLFHDENTNSDNQIIQLKKQKVNEMLKTNGEFWSHIIWSTRNMTSPPQTPPPTFSCSSNSSMISEEEEEELNIEDDPLPAVQQRKKTTNGRKRRGNLPKNVTAILKQWLIDHCKHPYPTEEEKRGLRIKTNLTLNQISNWFINARRRILPFIVSPSSTATKKSSTTTTTKRKRLDSE